MLISAIIGLLGSGLPHLLDMLGKWQDNKQELAILGLQAELQAQGHQEKLQEINTSADIAEMASLGDRVKPMGIRWLDALNGSVRPVLAYAFFLLYATVKAISYTATPWQLWTEADMDIFIVIITYYFGARTYTKLREGK